MLLYALYAWGIVALPVGFLAHKYLWFKAPVARKVALAGEQWAFTLPDENGFHHLTTETVPPGDVHEHVLRKQQETGLQYWARKIIV